MLLKCIGNTVEGLTDAQREHARPHLHMSSVHLALGQKYVALGVVFREGQPWFLLCEEEDAEYPTPHFHGFFEVADPRIPPGWSMTTDRMNFGAFALLPDAWARAPRFMESLVEGDSQAITEFRGLFRELVEWHDISPGPR